MNNLLSPIINIAELTALQQKNEVILIDARSGKNAKADYQKKHLAGALWVDLDTQLADIQDDPSKGGRHPLPTTEQFSKILASLGISPQNHVVVYDDKSGANAAARFWWMLRAAGHEKVQVLDGGFQEAERSGFPMNDGNDFPLKNGSYNIEKWKLPIADMTEVERAVRDEKSVVIDVRESGRYKGHFEPIDLIAGHIPGAINIPYVTNLDERGHFLPARELRKKYGEIFDKIQPEKVIVHCGSGVTACHTILAMVYAGYEMPKLYTGSWSEWSRNDKPIGVGA